MIARLSRIVPMFIVLAVIAGIVYVVVAWRYSPNRAKELLVKMFTAVTGGLSVLFLLVCAYALLDHNEPVFDLALSFLLTALVGLGITQICRLVFLRHNPAYRFKAAKTTKGESRTSRWRRK